MENKLSRYLQIIEDFVGHKILVQDFERDYLQMVKGETFLFDKDIARIIETLFSDIDMYCGDPEIANYDPNDPLGNIDENELRRRARKALEQLVQKAKL